MKKLLKTIGLSVVSAVVFTITTILLVYAATTISGLGQGEIQSGDKIGTGWFNEVDDKISSGGMVPQGAVMMFDKTSCPNGWTKLDSAQDRFIVGAGNNYTKGDTGGKEEVVLTIDQMPNHTHDIYKKDNDGSNSEEGGTLDDKKDTWKWSSLSTSEPAGGDQAHENRPPYLALLYCKKE